MTIRMRRAIGQSLSLILLLNGSLLGQSSILFVPTTDTQEKKSLYLSLESYAHFDKYEKGGFQTYGPSVVYGVSKNVEIGLNYYFTDDVDGSGHELQPNIKWKAYENADKGVAVAVGSVLPSARLTKVTIAVPG